MNLSPRPTVFVSYTSQDLTLVRTLVQALRAHGWSVWQDESGIEPAADIAASLAYALLDVGAVLFVASPAAQASPWVARELEFAERNGLPVLALELDHAPWSPELTATLSSAERWTLAPQQALDAQVGSLSAKLEAVAAHPSPLLELGLQWLKPRIWTPALLLDARMEVVPFEEAPRTAELRYLDAFCHSDAKTSICLLIGPGGAGKTRLLLHSARSVRDRGWNAGFLTHENLVDAPPMLAQPARDTLAVVDYAETRLGLQSFLHGLISARRANHARARLRIVLLARESSDWWSSLVAHPDIAACIHAPVRRVEPLRLDTGARAQMYDVAMRAFCTKLDAQNEVQKPPGPLSPDLSAARFGRVLYVHMAAIATLRQSSLRAEDLLTDTIHHEMAFWSQAYDDLDSTTQAQRLRDSQRLATAAVLRGGMPDRRTALAVGGNLNLAQAPVVIDTLQLFYGGSAQPQRLDRFLRPLQPDLLGEALVAYLLRTIEPLPEQYLHQILKDLEQPESNTMNKGSSSEEVFIRVFSVLARVAEEYETAARDWLRWVLGRSPLQRGFAAFNATLAVGRDNAFLPLGEVLADALRGMDPNAALPLATRIYDAIPRDTVALRGVALWAGELVLASLGDAKNQPPGDAQQVARAEALLEVSLRRSELDQPGSEQLSQEALAIYEQLASHHPDRYQIDYARALHDVALEYSQSGETRRASLLAERAVAVYRDWLQRHGSDDGPLARLANTLNSYALVLRDADDAAAAYTAAHEAEAVHAEVASRRGDSDSLADLARARLTLATVLESMGRADEAIATTERAVTVWRKLASDNSDAHVTGLAMALANLATYTAAGRDERAALPVFREALEENERLYRTAPEAFGIPLARARANLANSLWRAGRLEEARSFMDESVPLLEGKHSREATAELARVLANASGLLGELGEEEDSLRAAQRARRLYAQLEHSDTGRLADAIAMAVSAECAAHMQLGQWDEAMHTALQAVQMWTPLYERYRDRHRRDLARAYNSLALTHIEMNQQDQAYRAIRYAVRLYHIERSRGRPVLPDYAGSLYNLAIIQEARGHLSAAAAAAGASASHWRHLIDDGLSLHRVDFARVRMLSSSIASSQGQPEEAAHHLDAAIAAQRCALEEDPRTAPVLLALLYNRAGLAMNAEHPALARQLLQEAVDLLEDDDPDAEHVDYLLQLAGACLLDDDAQSAIAHARRAYSIAQALTAQGVDTYPGLHEAERMLEALGVKDP